MLKQLLMLGLLIAVPAIAATPNVGEQAPDFALATPDGQQVSLHSLTAQGKTVLVVLRGYPGYQCPYCQRQVGDFLAHADAFAQAKAQVLLVYPGPRAELSQRAKEFLDKRDLPHNIRLVIDPDYTFTRLYGLRWDASNETAYPSTFIIGQHGVVLFRKISHGHGDRMTANDALAQLSQSQR
jgi:peroxiredoxin